MKPAMQIKIEKAFNTKTGDLYTGGCDYRAAAWANRNLKANWALWTNDVTKKTDQFLQSIYK